MPRAGQTLELRPIRFPNQRRNRAVVLHGLFLAEKPTNDQLGHRLFMQDPQLALTSIGAAEGYHRDEPGVPIRGLGRGPDNPDAPTPSGGSWPRQFFPSSY